MHPLYAMMKFPPYEFVEYPKHIPLADGGFIIVNSAAEEQAKAPEIFAQKEAAEQAKLAAEAQRQIALKTKLVQELMPEIEAEVKERLRMEIRAQIEAEISARAGAKPASGSRA